MDKWKEALLGGLAICLIAAVMGQASSDTVSRDTAWAAAYGGGALVAVGLAMWWIKTQREVRQRRRDGSDRP